MRLQDGEARLHPVLQDLRERTEEGAVVIPRTTKVLLLHLKIPGEPVPWMRSGRRAGGGSYTPAKMAAQQNLIGLLARQSVDEPTGDPIIMEMNFFLGNLRRADLSNFWKLAEDALIGIAYVDDSQVVDMKAHKHVDRAFPRTELWVWRIPI